MSIKSSSSFWNCLRRTCFCIRSPALAGRINECAFIKTATNTSYLDNVTYKDTVQFVIPITYGKVIKVYDGDTITIAAKLPYSNGIEEQLHKVNSIYDITDTVPIYRFNVRLSGIDSPEIKGKSQTERDLAMISRDRLHKQIFGKIVHLKNISTEKYGRILADVYLDDLHINQWMLQEKLAVEYDGGTKIRPSNWDTK